MYWTVGLEGGPKRVNHAAVAVKDKIYSFGGYCNGGDYINNNIDVYILNTTTLRWKYCECTSKDGRIPFQRYGHTVVAYKDKIYLWGGRNELRACSQLYSFDTNTHTWSVPNINGSEPLARDGHSACVIGCTMYIFAGYLDDPGVYTQEISALNLETLTWRYVSTKEPKPLYRDFHTATEINGLMYVWGGREVPSGWHDIDGDGEYGSQMYVFDPDSEQWNFITAFGDIPVGRRSHSAVAYKNKLYVFGGYNSKENFSHYNDLHVFDPETRTWTKLNAPGCVPHPRRRQAFCLVDSKVYMFGGTSPNPNPAFYSDSDCDDPAQNEDRELVDHSDLYVLDLDPSLQTLALMKVLEYKLDTKCLPITLQLTIKFMTLPNEVFRMNNQSG